MTTRPKLRFRRSLPAWPSYWNSETEDQKQRHIPPILRGDTFWMQFLSEPSGGSDVAGAQTTAMRDGDEWVMNGSKIWTTGAWWADWAAVWPGPIGTSRSTGA